MTSERSDLLRDAVARALAYRRASVDASVYPSDEAIAALGGFDGPLPEDPSDPAEVLARLDELGSPATTRSTVGRYFGFVNGGTEPVAAAASVLSGAWDQNAALPIMSPAAAAIDRTVTRWVIDLLGLPNTAVATFASGASVANLACLVTARDALLHRAGWDVSARGLQGAPPIRVVVSEEVHVSVFKALRVIGIGRQEVVFAAADAVGAIDPATMPATDDMTLVVLQAGNVNTGHSDPFAALIPGVQEAGGWVHVDGAFGLWAAAAPDRQRYVAGVELADSWATDAHKWLNAPYDAGLSIVRDEADLRRAMAIDAAYLSTASDRALMHLSLQMSQRARAVETWAIIAALGRRGVADLIETSCRHAARFAELLGDAGVEVLAPPVLNQCLVAFGDDRTTDAAIEAVQSDGTCWVGGTTWHGRRAMRISVSDSATTVADVERAATAILRCRNELLG